MSKRKYEWRYDFINESRKDKTDWTFMVIAGVLLLILFILLFIVGRAIHSA